MKQSVKHILLLIFLIGISHIRAQEQELILATGQEILKGTLLTPKENTKGTLVVFISGSGPTDRNGNQPQLQSNYIKLLAESLAKEHIASFRYDKRGSGKSTFTSDQQNLRFHDYANDLNSWVNYLSNREKYDRIIVAGHSEGSLIALLAALQNQRIKGYISIAGAGRPIDIILKEQLGKQPSELTIKAYSIIDALKKGDLVSDIPNALQPLFNASVQPYLQSWMKYDPAAEIARLKIPALIIQGDRDIQITVTDAQLLAKANPKASLRIIHNMNHVLRDCNSTNQFEQMTTYTHPTLPVNKELVQTMVKFIIH